jgi:CRP-like cAMP-binding protein
LKDAGVNPKGTSQNNRLTAGDPLASVDLFRGIPDSSLQAIQQNSKVRDFRAGHVFFKTGEAGHALFLIENGAVQTFRTSGTKKLIVAELKPPAIFGEMGCIGGRFYHCDAQATEPSRIRIFSRSDVDALLEQHPVIMRQLLDLVSQRFVHVLMDLDATSFRSLIPRLASLLLERTDGCSFAI